MTQHPHRAARRPLQLGGIAMALALLQAPAWATSYIWQGGSGVWDDPGRWTLLGVPGSGDTATVQGTGTGEVLVRDLRSVGELIINGNLASTSTLTAGALTFESGYFGRTIAQGAGGIMNVTGNTVFNGAFVQTVAYSSTINLGGNATWLAGNGRISVEPAYSAGAQSYATSVLNIGAGTTFSDLGAAGTSGFKVISGTNIDGTYLRSGVGDTYGRNINVNGTLNIASGNFIFDTGNYANTSRGTINVASGSTLGLANITFTQGSVINNGLVRQYGGNVTVSSGVQIGGAWQMDQGVMTVEGNHTLASLVLNGNQINGAGTLTTGSLTFNGGKMGGTSGALGGGTLAVTGTATLSGSSVLNVDYNHTLNLGGATRWTAGDGRLAVSTGGSSGPDAHLNVLAGATFTDEGSAAANSYKTLVGSRLFTNSGTYVRTGLGETYASGFSNAGLLRIDQGTFSVDASFSNTGRVHVASGARLMTYSNQFVSNGALTGDGVVKTLNAGTALTSHGSINPGQDGSAGTLTIDGDLTLSGSSVLHIDLTSNGADKLVVTSDALWRGELSIWGGADLSLQVGDAYTIASFSQRVSNSVFDSISWHGLNGNQFAIDYTTDSIVLRVTAVPEPASYALWALGLALVAGCKSRRGANTRA